MRPRRAVSRRRRGRGRRLLALLLCVGLLGGCNVVDRSMEGGVDSLSRENELSGANRAAMILESVRDPSSPLSEETKAEIERLLALSQDDETLQLVQDLMDADADARIAAAQDMDAYTLELSLIVWWVDLYTRQITARVDKEIEYTAGQIRYIADEYPYFLFFFINVEFIKTDEFIEIYGDVEAFWEEVESNPHGVAEEVIKIYTREIRLLEQSSMQILYSAMSYAKLHLAVYKNTGLCACHLDWYHYCDGALALDGELDGYDQFMALLYTGKDSELWMAGALNYEDENMLNYIHLLRANDVAVTLPAIPTASEYEKAEREHDKSNTDNDFNSSSDFWSNVEDPQVDPEDMEAYGVAYHSRWKVQPLSSGLVGSSSSEAEPDKPLGSGWDGALNLDEDKPLDGDWDGSLKSGWEDEVDLGDSSLYEEYTDQIYQAASIPPLEFWQWEERASAEEIFLFYTGRYTGQPPDMSDVLHILYSMLTTSFNQTLSWIISYHAITNKEIPSESLPAKPTGAYTGQHLCTQHFISYHTITPELIAEVGHGGYNRFLEEAAGSDCGLLDVRSFVQYFGITRERFIEMHAGYSSGYLPYNVDWVYGEDADVFLLPTNLIIEVPEPHKEPDWDPDWDPDRDLILDDPLKIIEEEGAFQNENWNQDGEWALGDPPQGADGGEE